MAGVTTGSHQTHACTGGGQWEVGSGGASRPAPTTYTPVEQREQGGEVGSEGAVGGGITVGCHHNHTHAYGGARGCHGQVCGGRHDPLPPPPPLMPVRLDLPPPSRLCS